MKFFNSVNVGGEVFLDIGTDVISVYIKGDDTLFSEASAVAYNTNTEEIEAYGNEALIMEGRASNLIKVIHPIQRGVIAEFDFACDLLSHIIKKACQSKLVKPKIIVSVSPNNTDINRRALMNALIKAGARSIVMADSFIASALGAGADVMLSRAIACLDIGSSKSEIGIISSGNVVHSDSIALGGADFTNLVKSYVKKKFNLIIGDDMAKYVKENAFFSESPKAKNIYISGIDKESSLPRKIKISPIACENVFSEHINSVADLVVNALSKIPGDMKKEIKEDGILLLGGGAKLVGILGILKKFSKIKFVRAERSELSTINGLKVAYENIDVLPGVLEVYHEK